MYVCTLCVHAYVICVYVCTLCVYAYVSMCVCMYVYVPIMYLSYAHFTSDRLSDYGITRDSYVVQGGSVGGAMLLGYLLARKSM